MTNRNPLNETAADARALPGETLSCLVDGELDAAECARLLERLGADRDARRQWLLLHVAGDALRSSEVASLHSEPFVARFSAALAAEPAIVAPRATRSRARLVRRVVLPGAAVAAAAVMLVVVAVPQLRGTEPAPTQTASAPAAAPVPVVAVTKAPAVPAAANDVRRLAELEAYLSAHRELAGSSMMPRSAEYLRAATTSVR